MRYFTFVAILLFAISAMAAPRGQTVVGIRGPLFTINGHLTYTPEAGFPNADPNIYGTLLNVRSVQAIFDDANYPMLGSRQNPYASDVMGDTSWEYPDTGKWDPERNTKEFIAGLAAWRRAGLLAFTVCLQGGMTGGGITIPGASAPTQGAPNAQVQKENLISQRTLEQGAPRTQVQENSGFDAEGNLKPAYAKRLESVIAAADRQGMVVIVCFFYGGQADRIKVTTDERYIRQAITQGVEFLKSLPYHNVLIEINNEANNSYAHPLLRPDEDLAEAVLLAKKVAGGQFPVSFSYVNMGGAQQRSAQLNAAMRAVDYVTYHGEPGPESVGEHMTTMREWAGYDRPVMVNEDGRSSFNVYAASKVRVSWGFNEMGTANYRDGYQCPPVNWGINTSVKWLYFAQVARLTGSPVPPMPKSDDNTTPIVKLNGLTPGQAVKGGLEDLRGIEAVVEDRHPRWPILRVEFFIDGEPYSYDVSAPYTLGGGGSDTQQATAQTQPEQNTANLGAAKGQDGPGQAGEPPGQAGGPPGGGGAGGFFGGRGARVGAELLFLSPGRHVLRVAAVDSRGFLSEATGILEVPFIVEK